ncbi:MAG TPA: TlyA family RNA methyltransferase [Verrucomicrobiae bacterium]|jgi:23S rRNA (cytidine1920-2'-O)/16S rRNA (cytidine1409-2'-O)-methyltransferase|nr:TlyA family RNA methyltransferase [Verrucomicrobiae bacterium]
MIRLDQALVERGLCESREKAKRAVMAGVVTVNGQLARKASDSVKPEDVVALTAAEKFVSRGGHKLEHALKHFQLEVAGATAIDLGASTGGFTDCLLQYGAAKVFAVDVGQGQLAWKLRRDKRVVVMEKVNARAVRPGDFQGGKRKAESGNREAEGDVPSSEIENRKLKIENPPADLVVIDCSFISLRKILPAAVDLLRTSGNIVALIKPQFEAGKPEVDKGEGVITDPAIHERVLRELEEFVARENQLRWRGVTESPLLGPAGNKEFLVLLEKIS